MSEKLKAYKKAAERLDAQPPIEHFESSSTTELSGSVALKSWR